ncbi:MAG: flippase [Eubacteriales bacterium]
MGYKLKENMMYNVGYQFINLLVPLATIPYISRILGVNGVGLYSFTFSIVSIATTFAALGGDAHGNRCIASSKEDVKERSKEFIGVFIVQIVASFISIVFYLIYSLKSSEYTILLLWQGINLLACLFNVNWFFYGLGNFKYMIKRNIFVKIISLVSIFIFVKSENDVWIYIAILSLCNLISAIVVWPKVLKSICFVKIEIQDIMIHVEPMLKLFISVLAISLYKKMDKVMIGAFSSITQNGYYENVDKILQIPTSIISAVGLVMLPQITRMIAMDKEDESIKLMNRIIQILIILSGAMCFGILAVSKELVIVFFGNEFLECVNLMNLLAVVIIFQTISNMLRSAYLIPHCYDNIYLKSTISGTIINLVLNVLLISKYGAYGAAIATIAAEFMVVVVQLFFIRGEINIMSYMKQVIESILCAIPMYILIMKLKIFLSFNETINLIIEVFSGLLIYVAIFGLYLFVVKRKSIKEYFMLQHTDKM